MLVEYTGVRPNSYKGPRCQQIIPPRRRPGRPSVVCLLGFFVPLVLDVVWLGFHGRCETCLHQTAIGARRRMCWPPEQRRGGRRVPESGAYPRAVLVKAGAEVVTRSGTPLQLGTGSGEGQSTWRHDIRSAGAGAGVHSMQGLGASSPRCAPVVMATV